MRFVIGLLSACLLLNAAESRQLFNGKDLTGWKTVGPGRFVLEDGLLKTEGGMGLLYYTREKFGNQTIHVVFKTASPTANSGVYIRMAEMPKDPWYGVHNGYEVQIDAAGDDWHCTGAIYSLSKAMKRAQKPIGEWNTMDIQLKGQTTTVILNGEKVNEFTGNQEVPERKQWFEPVRGPRPDTGYIGLQNHDTGSTVYFKEVSVAPAASAGPALSQHDRDFAMSYYHATGKQILDAVAGLTPAQWAFKPAADKWSIADIVEHLTIVENGLFDFALSGLAQPPVAKTGGITDEKVMSMMKDRSQKAEAPAAFRPTGRWTPQDLAREFHDRRDRNIVWIQNTQEDLRSHQSKTPVGVLDVYQALLMIPAHTERHLAQINEVKAAAGYPK
jgi:hypothetical protein